MLYMVRATKSTEFFIYTHTFSNGVIYVGKGRRARILQMAASRTNSKYWVRLFEKYGAPAVHVVAGPLDEELALLGEMEYIAKLRSLGAILCNLTDGGDGGFGRVATPEQRKANSLRGKTYYALHPEERATAAARLSAYVRSPDVIAVNVARLRATSQTETAKKNRARAMQSTEVKAKQSAAQKAAWAAPGARERRLQSFKARTPAKLSIAMKALFADKTKHPRTDHTVYTFEHPVEGTFIGRRIDLCDRYGVSASQLTAVIRGRFKSTKNWKLKR